MTIMPIIRAAMTALFIRVVALPAQFALEPQTSNFAWDVGTV
jgi:hypothetical protein